MSHKQTFALQLRHHMPTSPKIRSFATRPSATKMTSTKNRPAQSNIWSEFAGTAASLFHTVLNANDRAIVHHQLRRRRSSNLPRSEPIRCLRKYGVCASSAAAGKPVDGAGACDCDKSSTRKDDATVGEPNQAWIGISSPSSSAAVRASPNPRTTHNSRPAPCWV